MGSPYCAPHLQVDATGVTNYVDMSLATGPHVRLMHFFFTPDVPALSDAEVSAKIEALPADEPFALLSAGETPEHYALTLGVRNPKQLNGMKVAPDANDGTLVFSLLLDGSMAETRVPVRRVQQCAYRRVMCLLSAHATPSNAAVHYAGPCRRGLVRQGGVHARHADNGPGPRRPPTAGC